MLADVEGSVSLFCGAVAALRCMHETEKAWLFTQRPIDGPLLTFLPSGKRRAAASFWRRVNAHRHLPPSAAPILGAREKLVPYQAFTLSLNH